MNLEWLRDIARAKGPFATVYLDVSHDTPDAPRRIELTWRRARADLAGAGAEEVTLTALDEAVGRLTNADAAAFADADADVAADRPAGPAGRVLVAAGGSVLLDEWLSHPPAQSATSWAEAPDLVPALTELPERVATVVAVVDAAGPTCTPGGVSSTWTPAGTRCTGSGPAGWPT